MPMNQMEIEEEIENINSARKRTLSGQENIIRDAQSNKWIVGVFTSGKYNDRPSTTYMFERGSKSMLYFATDTFVLSAWTGTEWKETTLS